MSLLVVGTVAFDAIETPFGNLSSSVIYIQSCSFKVIFL